MVDRGELFVQAHRGAGAGEPENTLEACLTTWKLSPRLVPELDISTTADGVIVAFHDKDLRRVVGDATPELTGKCIGDLTWEEARSVDVGAAMGPRFRGRCIGRIADAFAQVAGRPERRLYLDYKRADLANLAVLVYGHGVAGQVILASNDAAILAEWKRRVPESETLLWVWHGADMAAQMDAVRRGGFAGITQLQLHTQVGQAGELSPTEGMLRALAEECRGRGIVLQTFPFTDYLGAPCASDVYRRLLELGVTSFATDYPLEALRAIEAFERRRGDAPAKELPKDPIEVQFPRTGDTWNVIIGTEVLGRVDAWFHRSFGSSAAGVVVADENTWAAAGQFVHARLGARRVRGSPLIFGARPALHAEMQQVERIEAMLAQVDAIPVAVGAGTINDLVKLAAGRCGRPYMVVGTAASMDGYAAFGASITEKGSKQTFDCPAPRAVLVDLDVVAEAPATMAATGYADLLAKVTAGADWILADALGIEPLCQEAWELVQTPLRGWLADPEGVRRAERGALRNLISGLVHGGLAMQVTKTSRPASGAEHQFSHLWDMEGHRHQGEVVPHGSKVAIGTLAVCGIYQTLLAMPMETLDVAGRCAAWLELEQMEREVAELHGVAAIREKAVAESRAKYVTREQLQTRLERLRRVWPELREKLRRQLVPLETLRGMLARAGAPTRAAEIGISPERLRASVVRARTIRRRYTVLDLATEVGLLPVRADLG